MEKLATMYFAQAFVRESISTDVWKEEEDFRSHCFHPNAVFNRCIFKSYGGSYLMPTKNAVTKKDRQPRTSEDWVVSKHKRFRVVWGMPKGINCNIRHQLTHAFPFALRYTYAITIIETTPT